jgi:hypothetical protein
LACQAEAYRRVSRLLTAVDAELSQNRCDVMIDRLLGDNEAFCDFPVSQAARQQRQDL